MTTLLDLIAVSDERDAAAAASVATTVPDSGILTGAIEQPDETAGVSIAGTPAGGGSSFTRVDYVPAQSGEYYVYWENGRIEFHTSDAGTAITITYSGWGDVAWASHVNQYRSLILEMLGGRTVQASSPVYQYQCVSPAGASGTTPLVVPSASGSLALAGSIGIALEEIDTDATGTIQYVGVIESYPGDYGVGSRAVVGTDGYLAFIDDSTGATTANYPPDGNYIHPMGRVIADGVVLLNVSQDRPAESYT